MSTKLDEQRSSTSQLASLHEAVNAAALSPSAGCADLRAAVAAHTRAMKDAGHPPERVLITVKDAARQLRALPVDLRSQDAIRTEMVRACIREYYRAPAGDASESKSERSVG